MGLPVAQAGACRNATEIGLIRLRRRLGAPLGWRALVGRVINLSDVREVPLVCEGLPSFDLSIGYRVQGLCCRLNGLWFVTFVLATLFLKPQVKKRDGEVLEGKKHIPAKPRNKQGEQLRRAPPASTNTSAPPAPTPLGEMVPSSLGKTSGAPQCTDPLDPL